MDMYVIPFVVGLIGSLLMTKCWAAIAERARWRATFYEAGALAVAIVAWQLWAATDNDWRVLASESLGTVWGTWLAMR